MILATHVTAEAVLRGLLGRDKRRTMSAPGHSPSPHAATKGACSHEIAVHDAAALREGNLSPEGIRRLADHLTQCESCRILVAAIVDEAQRAEWTGSHSARRDRHRSER